MYTEKDTLGNVGVYDMTPQEADNLLQTLKTHVVVTARPVPPVVQKLIRQLTETIAVK